MKLLPSEIWRPIIGYEGIYEINTFQQIRGLEREITTSSTRRKVKSRLIKPRLNNDGYVELRLSKNGVTSTKFVHILSAKAFIPNLFNKPEVNHKNGIKTDNRPCNLEWVTHSENMLHAYKTGLIEQKAKPIIDICTGKEFSGTKEASNYLGINRNTLKCYLNGTIKKNPTCLQYAA